MARRSFKTWAIVLLCGGMPLITSVTCDSYAGVVDFYRDDDAHFFFDDVFYVEDVYYYEECFILFCF